MLPRLFVAVDTPDEKDAVALGTSLAALDGVGIKLGLEFFGSLGPQGIAAVKAAAPSTPIFLDLKFHDIPNTVAGVIHSILPLEPTLITLHSSGGPAMMKAAVRQSPCPLRFRCLFIIMPMLASQVAAAAEGAEKRGCTRPKLLAVTVLTSLDDADLAAVGQSTPAEAQVVRLAELAQSCGMDGVVCSAREIEPIRKACGKDFVLVVPGIRPAGADHGDQKRVVTPAAAITSGASCLVVGRPITQAADPQQAAAGILAEIAGAASEKVDTPTAPPVAPSEPAFDLKALKEQEAAEMKKKIEENALKAKQKEKEEDERIAKMQALEAQGVKVAGGMHKFDASEVDVHGGNATADDFLDAFGM